MQEAVVDGVGQYMESVLQPVLVQGLTVLAKEKPCAHPIEALSFLGQWLLDNNPNKVCVHTVNTAAYCLGIPSRVVCDCHIQLKSAAAIKSKFCLNYLVRPGSPLNLRTSIKFATAGVQNAHHFILLHVLQPDPVCNQSRFCCPGTFCYCNCYTHSYH